MLERQTQQEDLKKLETFGILVYCMYFDKKFFSYYYAFVSHYIIFYLERDFFIYSTHWVNGLYLVEQVNRFTIPDTANQLNELPSIISVTGI